MQEEQTVIGSTYAGLVLAASISAFQAEGAGSNPVSCSIIKVKQLRLLQKFQLLQRKEILILFCVGYKQQWTEVATH